MQGADMLRITQIAIGCAVLTVGGCAANDERAEVADNVDDQLEQAAASITEAENAGAYERGSAALNTAREKLGAAEDAAEDGEPELAARLAKEAQLDATLASAIADNEEMQAALTELERSLETLEQEIARNAQAPNAGAPGAQPPAGGVPF
jgi:hypothetical protein